MCDEYAQFKVHFPAVTAILRRVAALPAIFKVETDVKPSSLFEWKEVDILGAPNHSTVPSNG